MGELKGAQLLPRVIARLCWETGWQDAEGLVVAVAVCLSESQGYAEAHNTNTNGSEDFGLFQINVEKDEITDAVAKRLYTPKENVEAAYALYMRRGFQPWYGFTKGVYLHDAYIGRALVGVGNFLGERLLAEPVPDWNGEPYVHKFETPIVDYRFRVQALVKAAVQARNTFRTLKRSGDAAALQSAMDYVKRTRP